MKARALARRSNAVEGCTEKQPPDEHQLKGGIMRLVMLAAASILICGSASAQDKATIEKLNEAFTSAFKKGDYGAVGGMYTDDAYLLPAGSAMVKGRSKITAFWTKTGEAISDAKLTTVDVKPLGNDSAREIGTFALTTKGPQPQQLTGKYVVVWQKVGSGWKLATDIWNSDK
jgi:uncharacterized protein (TIGR02246 family)